jgi:hypothetical protein
MYDRTDDGNCSLNYAHVVAFNRCDPLEILGHGAGSKDIEQQVTANDHTGEINTFATLDSIDNPTRLDGMPLSFGVCAVGTQ